MKRILCITGTRADFGKLKPLLHYMDDHLDLHLLVTGAHMMSRYGSTYIEVEREKFKHTYLIPNQVESEPMSDVTANSINIFSRHIQFIKPDLIIIHGDRVEALAGAIAGALNNVRICHIEGGELSGTIDDSLRHAVSKLSQIHMVANEEAKQRLIRMGEHPNHIFIIGSPDIDVMLSPTLPNIDAVKKHYNIQYKNYVISMFHPVTTEQDHLAQYAREYFDALKASHLNYVVIYPNNDLGSDFILSEISQLPADRFRCFPSIRFESFLTLMKHAQFVIGNSSAGVREAPIYGIRSINVGSRQHQRATSSLITNTSYNSQDILKAIQSLGKEDHTSLTPSNEFGEGNSVKLFEQSVQDPNFWNIPIQKTFYHQD